MATWTPDPTWDFMSYRSTYIPANSYFLIANTSMTFTLFDSTVAADAWDEAVRRRAMEIDGTLDAWAQFQALDWNMYRATEPDPIDKPSSVFEHLRWLEAAGLDGVANQTLRCRNALGRGIDAQYVSVRSNGLSQPQGVQANAAADVQSARAGR